jgi:hypothetical protein
LNQNSERILRCLRRGASIVTILSEDEDHRYEKRPGIFFLTRLMLNDIKIQIEIIGLIKLKINISDS